MPATIDQQASAEDRAESRIRTAQAEKIYEALQLLWNTFDRVEIRCTCRGAGVWETQFECRPIRGNMQPVVRFHPNQTPEGG